MDLCFIKTTYGTYNLFRRITVLLTLVHVTFTEIVCGHTYVSQT